MSEKIGFKRDWFNRSEKNAYSHYDQRNRLFDWDKDMTNSYSSYFVRDNESLKSAAQMIGSMFRVIGVEKSTKLNHSNVALSKGDDIQIPVPLKMLRDDEGNYKNHDAKLLDAFYGASIQNAALATMQSKTEFIRTAQARSSETPTTPQDLLFSILNTERIDKKLADRFPGYSKFVQKFKQYKYDETYEPLAPEEHQGKRLLELVSKFLRYPAHVSDEELEEFKKPLEQIEHYVKKHGFPKTSTECEQQASYMYNVVQKYIEEEEKKPEEEGGGKGSGPSGDDMNELAKSLMEQMVNGDDGDETIDTEFEDFTEDMEEKKSALPSSHDFKKTGEMSEGNIKFIKADSNKERYKKELLKIDTCKASVLAHLFARKCKDYAFSMKSMRSGRLDTNKIAEAKQNVPTIYERFGEVKTNKLNIGVLIDESGSMGSSSKIEKARQAAIFMYEVFKKVPDVRMYMYGHTADGGGGGGHGDCIMRIYNEAGKGSNGHALGSVSARHNNRDGDAILAAAKRIRSMNSDPCLLFVISDGAPYAINYSGQAAINDTRKKVTQAQALGFQVIQIAIEEEVPSEEMFDYSIKMTDIKNLPNDLIAYVSKRVDKLIKSRVIM
jgi:hypothetical protein